MNVVNCPSSSALQSLTPVSHTPVCFLDTVVLPGCLQGCWDLAHLEGTVKKQEREQNLILGPTNTTTGKQTCNN